MRRLAISFAVLVGAGLFWIVAGGAGGGGTGSRTYWVQLDNAFGLVSGADVKVAGVRVGKIGGFKLDRTTYRALVQLDIDQKGFDQFRSDAFCESKPQSLIGEYFIDCQPGANGQPLADGATIPVSQTASTVAPDLVNNILRLPYRERLRIILNELGAGVAGQETNINDAIRRAVPALRDTDRTLKILADENHTLADLVTNGDAVITPLARNHAQVGRWVLTAGATAKASALRRVELAQTFHKLPFLLEQLRPNMVALGQVAVSQTPALANLNASAGQLTRFFTLLKPFANAYPPPASPPWDGRRSPPTRRSRRPPRPSRSSTPSPPRRPRSARTWRSSCSTSTIPPTRSRPTSAPPPSTPTGVPTTPAWRRCCSTSSTRARRSTSSTPSTTSSRSTRSPTPTAPPTPTPPRPTRAASSSCWRVQRQPGRAQVAGPLRAARHLRYRGQAARNEIGRRGQRHHAQPHRGRALDRGHAVSLAGFRRSRREAVPTQLPAPGQHPAGDQRDPRSVQRRAVGPVERRAVGLRGVGLQVPSSVLNYLLGP